ncbi:MAG: TlpA family protein disulfide reductase [Chthonomonas sp.]|nr:TlpA family protein disulfide reductase [Chthonomonas sp.]
MKKLTLSVAALALSACLFAAGPQLRQPLPAFSMKDLAGKTHTNKSLKGKVILLDFWATWCGPCKQASPMMQRLHTKYAKRGLVAIGANAFEKSEDKSFAEGYRKEHKYTYTFTFGNSKLADSWGITGIPYFVLVDKKGVVQWIGRGFNGATMESELSKAIDGLIK